VNPPETFFGIHEHKTANLNEACRQQAAILSGKFNNKFFNLNDDKNNCLNNI
jgi:geranylgeranyl pyrophosphate synthase